MHLIVKWTVGIHSYFLYIFHEVASSHLFIYLFITIIKYNISPTINFPAQKAHVFGAAFLHFTPVFVINYGNVLSKKRWYWLVRITWELEKKVLHVFFFFFFPFCSATQPIKYDWQIINSCTMINIINCQKFLKYNWRISWLENYLNFDLKFCSNSNFLFLYLKSWTFNNILT